jgi:peptidoglycan/LPS O-acetylase OafA/YrhL
MLIVTSISFLPACQKGFTTPLSQYIGKISYALYLTHWIVIRVFALRFRDKIWSVTRKDTELGYHGGILLTGILYIFVCVWMADLYWRMVDLPTIGFARWLEKKCLAKTRP